MIRKFASADIIGAEMGSDAGFSKSAHRAVFNYTPREGYLYVRSRAISSRCNDNFDMFPAGEIEAAYKTFLGKPVFVNHHNEDHRRMRGVIIDAALHKDINPDGSPDTWVELLHEVDAVKFPKLAKAILAKEVNRTSMGCDVQFSKCSVCENVATSPLEYCQHIPSKKGKRIYQGVGQGAGTREGKLVFEICSGLSFFENSLLVEQPADPTAYFLGDVEAGPGLERLSSIYTPQTFIPGPIYATSSRSFGKTSSRQNPVAPGGPAPMSTTRVWNLLKQAAAEDAPVAKTSVWDMIREADLIGDDLDNTLFPYVAMNTSESEDYVRNATDNGKGVKNILDLVGKANHTELKSGMNWYGDAHKMAKSIVDHHRQNPDHMLSKDSHADALHKVAGTIGVYSEGTAPAPNFHYASEAIHHQQPIYSHPQYHKDENGQDAKDDKGKKIPVLDDEGKHVNNGFLPNSTYHGLPTASSAQAGKVRSFFKGGKIDDVMKTAHKTRNYSSLIENPDSQTDEGKDRVVVDRHAIAAVMGHQGSSGEVYNGKGSTFLGRASGKGKFKDGNYEHVADMYRQAAHHINTSPEHADLRQHLQDSGMLKRGEQVRGHHVQAISWIKQKQISDSHNRSNSGTQRAIDDFHQHYTDRYGATGHQPSSWQGFAGGDARHGSRHPFDKWAYGETKAPQDVDTLRSENCTVCGNSSAFDGKQCQVCGYVAPPKAFGDPNTDVARDNDLRKQVLDGDEADPMDTDSPMGNQQGDPEELDQQQSDADAGKDDQMSTQLTCENCGTQVTPPPPTGDGEPPYPADGDVCPVCKSGQLASAKDNAMDDDSEVPPGTEEDQNGDGVPDDKEEADDDDSAPDDDEDEDEDDDKKPFPPKKKGK